MAEIVRIEIAGFENSECSPFPCDETRTCGLSDCHPTGKLTAAFAALQKVLLQEYGDRICLVFTPLDHGTPAHIKTIIEARHPALPIVIINGRVAPVGRIALDRIKREIEKEL